MAEHFTYEEHIANHPGYVLNSILFRLAKAVGYVPDEEGGIEVNADDLIADVEEYVWRYIDLQD